MNTMRTLVLATAALLPSLGHAQAKVDPKIAPYTPVAGISGSLNSIGSDTLGILMGYWREGFAKVYPSVKIEAESKGSNTAPPALIAGTAQLAPMSREMKSSEIDEFEKKFSYKPTCVMVAIDALAVYVHKDNPLTKLTLPEIDAIFSKARKLKHPVDITTWGQVGLTGDWSEKPVRIYGRNSASGTYNYFRDHALEKGDYKDTLKEQPGSAGVVQAVTEDLQGIGFSGIGFTSAGVKALHLAKKSSDPFFDPTNEDTVYSGKYPLARYLYIYVNKAPNKPLDPLVGEFLRFVLSQEGQQLVSKDGYLPLKSKVVAGELEKIGATTATGAEKSPPQDAGASKKG